MVAATQRRAQLVVEERRRAVVQAAQLKRDLKDDQNNTRQIVSEGSPSLEIQGQG